MLPSLRDWGQSKRFVLLSGSDGHNYCIILYYQVEVIGGADKYMAVCRACYKIPDKMQLSSTSPSPSKTTPIRGYELTIGRQLHYDDVH